MQSELVPAVVAVGGGGALVAAIAVHERTRESQMRASRRAYSVIFPLATDPAAALAALRSISGIAVSFELVAEVMADDSGIHHVLHLPERAAASVIDQLSAAMPGIRVDPVEPRSSGEVTQAIRFVVPARAVLRTDEIDHAGRALLTGLGSLRGGERVSLRWALRPAASAVPPAVEQTPTSLRGRAETRAWRERLQEPGFSAAGLLLVRAADPGRARQLKEAVIAIVRSRRGVGGGLMIRRANIRSGAILPSTGRTRGWLSVPELVGLLGWPLGKEAVAGVEIGAARRISVPRGLPREGRRLLIGQDAYGERPVALTADAARHHLAVVGPSGTGKSALLASGILDDLERGYGGVVIDPKGDLVADVLDRIPRKHVERVVVLDPSVDGPIPGLDLLRVGDPDLRSDVVLGALGAIFRDSWGVRTDTYLRLGLRTLSELPEPALTDWLRLFTDTAFRHRAVGHLSDPLLIAAWQGYEALSPAEQHQHIAAPMSKVLNLLSRPAVRAVLAQRQPKLDLAQLISERRWLFVSLSPGVLGEPASRLLGAILTYGVWTAIEARAAIPAANRHPVFFYLDELQSLASLPFGLEYLFERARGLGCGVTIATQALGRLPESVRQSLLGNVGSLVSFRLGYEEATRVSRELPGLGAQDLQALRQFEVAARIGTGAGSGVVTVTGRTDPLGPSTGQAAAVRSRSAQAYGQDPVALDQELRGHDTMVDEADSLGRTRRAS